jgi:hypothetical protein
MPPKTESVKTKKNIHSSKKWHLFILLGIISVAHHFKA